MVLKSLPSRVHLPAYLIELGLNGLGVEVGVADGWFSNQILFHSQLRLLFSVDPWSQTEAKECNLGTQAEYEQARITLNEHWQRSVILRMTSNDALCLFQYNIFDFVYIDSNHEFKDAYSDMTQWMLRLKPGGILAGHDYCDYHIEVKQAVDEFVSANHLTLYTTELDQWYEGHAIRSWYLQKPV